MRSLGWSGSVLPRMGARMDARHALQMAVLATLVFPALALALEASVPTPSMSPTSSPSPAATPSAATPAAATAPATTAPAPVTPGRTEALTQPFVGVIAGDRVNVRGGPKSNYYEIGQLTRGETVQVVGTNAGWYQISPPSGVYCLVAKEYVDLDAAGKTATVKADYLNVRAGSPYYPNRDEAVLTVSRKGTKFEVLGETQIQRNGETIPYVKVAPTDKCYVWVSSQYVRKAPESTAYKVPTLRGPGGVALSATTMTRTGSGNAGNGSGGTTTSREAVVEVTTNGSSTPGETQPTTQTAESSTQPSGQPTQPRTVVVEPQPVPAEFSSAYDKFHAINERTSEEYKKPLAQRDYEGLLKDYKALLEAKTLPTSVRTAAESRVALLQKDATIQKLAKEARTDTALDEQRKALQEQAESALKAVDEAQRTGPYLAEGRLQTSATVKDKYVLVNPSTGRVVAYVDPAADVEISKLLGEYIGVRGTTGQAKDAAVKVIKVKTAELLKDPNRPER